MKRIVFCTVIIILGVLLTLSLSVMDSPKAEAASASSVEAARQKMLEEDHKRAAKDRKEAEAHKAKADARRDKILRKAKEAGFIAYSEKPMTWKEAKAYCARHGGKLPRVNNSDTWDGKNPPARGVIIDGFGYGGRSWGDVGVPSGTYWTGTVNPHNLYHNPWYVTDQGGYGGIAIYNNDNSTSVHFVLCVP